MGLRYRPIDRREALATAAVCMAGLPIFGCTHNDSSTLSRTSASLTDTNSRTGEAEKGEAMRIHYLEMVTRDIDAACELSSGIHGITFAEPDTSLGGARVARLHDGGMMGIRGPMHDAEKPVTRAYMLVEDIQAAVDAAKNAGAEIAVPPMEIPGHGQCAIYIQGGIEAGFWQV